MFSKARTSFYTNKVLTRQLQRIINFYVLDATLSCRSLTACDLNSSLPLIVHSVSLSYVKWLIIPLKDINLVLVMELSLIFLLFSICSALHYNPKIDSVNFC